MLSTGGSRQDSPVNKPLNPQIKECYGIFEKARWSFKIFCTLYPWISSRIIDHLGSSLKHLKEWFLLYPDITFSALPHRQYLDIFLLIHYFLLAGNKTIHQKVFWNLGVDSNVAKFGLTECKWLKIEKKIYSFVRDYKTFQSNNMWESEKQRPLPFTMPFKGSLTGLFGICSRVMS